MKKPFLFFLVFTFFNIFLNAQALEVLCLENGSEKLSFCGDYTFNTSLFGNKIKIYDSKNKAPLKYNIEGTNPISNVVAMNNKWYFLKPPKEYKAEHALYNIAEWSLSGEKQFEAKAIDCHEKVGEVHIYGLVNYTTEASFGAKLFKSENNKYLLGVASKKYGNMGGPHATSAQGIDMYKDYDESYETTQFTLLDSKLNVIYAGSYDFKVKRKYIKELSAYVGDNGDVFLTLILHQEFVGVSNRIIVVKIQQNNANGEKVEINFEKFNSIKTLSFFKGNKIIFTGFTEEEASKELNIKGLFYASIDLEKMKVLEKNICLFNATHIATLNELHRELDLPVNKKDNPNILHPYFDWSVELVGEKEFLVAIQYKFFGNSDRNNGRTSSVAVLRLGDYGKQISKIYQYGQTLYKLAFSGMELMNINGKPILIYNDYSESLTKEKTPAQKSTSASDVIFGSGNKTSNNTGSLITKYVVFSENEIQLPIAKELKGLSVDKEKLLFVNYSFDMLQSGEYYILPFVSAHLATKIKYNPKLTFCRLKVTAFDY